MMLHARWIILITCLFLQSYGLASDIEGCIPITLSDAEKFNPPRFEDYPAPYQTMETLKPVNLSSHPLAKRFRTMLHSGAIDGPNFAGNFTIVGWGCGSSCLQFGIIDARNGRLFFPGNVRIVSATHVGSDIGEAENKYFALRFRLDSRLLIVLGAPNEKDVLDGISYYEWTGNGLKRVRFIRSRKQFCDKD